MDVYESIPEIHKIFQIFSLSQITISRNKKKLIKDRYWISWWKITIILFLIFSLFADVLLIDYLLRSGDDQYLQAVLQVMMHLMHLAVYLHSYSKSDLSLRIFEQLARIDTALRQIKAVEKNEVAVLRWRIIISSLAFLSLHLLSIAGYLVCNVVSDREQFHFIWTMLYIPSMGVLTLKIYQILLTVYLAKVQFDRLNSAMAAMLPTSPAENFRTLQIVQTTYDDLFDLVKKISDLFGLIIMLNVPVDIYNLTIDMYVVMWGITSDFGAAFQWGGGLLLWLPNVFFAVPNVLNFVSLVVLCQWTVNSSAMLKANLYNAIVDVANPQHTSLVEVLALQFQHKPIQFSVLGLLKIDSELLEAVAGSFTTLSAVLLEIAETRKKLA